jgi:RND family efflux transporter MFP subunit
VNARHPSGLRDAAYRLTIPRIAGLLLLCIAAPAWCADAASATPPARAEASAPSSGLSIRAQLLPRRYTTLAAEVGAKINRLPVPEGGRFQQGEIVVAFDCTIQQAQLQKAKAAYEAATRTWEANQRLAELNAVGKLELDVSKAEVEKNKAEVDSSAAYVSKCNIAAPFGGRVAEQKAREQQFVQPGQPLLEILDDSALELEFIVPSRWLAWLKAGHRFRVRIDETGRSYPAKVQRIGARVDPVSQSVKISAVIDGHFPELIAGMSGRASFSQTSAAR